MAAYLKLKGRLYLLLLNFYEGVRLIVLSVAIKTVFTKVMKCAPFGLMKMQLLTTKQLTTKFGHVFKQKLNRYAPFELQNIILQYKFSLFS
jgi:hypothetical protein